MKKYILVCLLSMVSLFAIAAGTKTVGTKKAETKTALPSIVFDGKAYTLRYSAGNSQEWLNEYLPAGATFDNYTHMFAVRSYDGLKEATPAQIINSMARNYRRQNPGISFSVFQGNNGDAGMGFIMIQGNVLENNLFRVTKSNGKLISLQFVYREYTKSANRTKEELAQAGAHIKTNLPRWKQSLLSMPVPNINHTVIQ